MSLFDPLGKFRKRFLVLGGGGRILWYRAGGSPDPIAVYQPAGAASLAASYTNLVNPGTYNATPGIAPAWDAVNGWKFAVASSHYLDTGITPTTGMSAIIKFSNVGNQDSYLFGSATDATTQFLTIPWLGGTNNVRYGNGGVATKVPYLTEGILAFAGTKCYRNGLDEGLTLGAWSGVSTHTVHIGRLNRAVPTGYITAYIQALAVYDTILTPAQVLAITTRLQSPFDPTPAGAGEIMLVHMSDTHYDESADATVHEQMTEYISSKASYLGVDIVLHGGDTVYPPVADAAQWASVDRMFSNLDAANVPYLVTVGNHDYDDDDGTDVVGRDTTEFNAIFPQSRYTSKSWWDGGFYEVGHSENAYLLMTIDSVDYIFISMEFGPRVAVLAWIDGLLTTYSTRHAIIVTHSHIHRDGTTVDAGDQYAPHPDYTLDGTQNNGDEALAALKSHDNIRLILSGHDKGTIGWATANREDASDGGVPINQMVANWQSYQDYGSGMMRFIRLNPTAKTIQVESYSHYMNMFFHDAANQFTVDWIP